MYFNTIKHSRILNTSSSNIILLGYDEKFLTQDNLQWH